MTALSASEKVQHIGCGAGVIGLGVSDEQGQHVLLSCAHVLAPRDKVEMPDPPLEQIIEVVPASSQHLRIGILKAYADLSGDVKVDCALASLDPDVTLPLYEVNGVPITGLWKAPANDDDLNGVDVWRIDQNGSHITGKLRWRDCREVPLGDGFPPVKYKNFIVYEALNAPGDSGGAVVHTETGKLVGIHFGGDANYQSWLCEAVLVFQALNIPDPGGS